MTTVYRTALLCLAFFWGSLALASNRTVRLELGPDFHSSYNSSERKDPNNGFSGLRQRDIGMAYHLRLSIELMDRKGRAARLLIGPYIRTSLLTWLSNYGNDIENARTLEGGGVFGMDWFQWVKTLFFFAPRWRFKYKSTDFTGDPEKLVEATYAHWSVGLRLEVPIFALHSDPHRGLVEWGVFGAYSADRITEIEFHPVRYQSTGGENPPLGSYDDTQGIRARWMAGIYMNVRI